jgi:hypothetical protein
MKKWTRAGLNELIRDELHELKPDSRVLSVGGHGPIDDFLKKIANENGWTLITLDIDPLHSPEILIDLADLSNLSIEQLPLMDAIVCLEVFEHVHRITEAINGIKFRLAHNGRLIASTPWIIPMHDRPNDYRRFTYEGIESLLGEFREIKIIARGNYIDSVIALMLRGTRVSGKAGKFFAAFGVFCALLRRNPRIYSQVNSREIDSPIGYFFTGKM